MRSPDPRFRNAPPHPRIRSTRAALLAACLAAAALAGCDRTPPDAPKPAAADAAPVVPFDPSLSVVNNAGAIRFDGTVNDAASKTQIERALLSAYGAGRATGDLTVDAAARPPKWVAGLGGFLKAFEPAAGAALTLEGERAVLGGRVEPDMRAPLRAAAEAAFPGIELAGLFVLPEAPEAPPEPGSIAPAELAKRLARAQPKYEPGDGNVSAESLDLVAQIADSIRAAPANTRVRIVGPVVASADAGNDVFLSKQRAEALKVQLILNGISPAAIETRGWGQNPDGTPIEGAKIPPEGAPMRFELVK